MAQFRYSTTKIRTALIVETAIWQRLAEEPTSLRSSNRAIEAGATVDTARAWLDAGVVNDLAEELLSKIRGL